MDAMNEQIREELFRLRDDKYREFQSKLIPTVGPDTMIGVRTQELRRLAKQLVKREDVSGFLEALPHRYFDEIQLHGFILSETKDFDRCLEGVQRFLPYIDNWATCDQLSPKVFARHRSELIWQIGVWLRSGETYTVRFAVGMLMQHYLDDAFDLSYPKMVAGIRSEEYYVNMMIAWYFATALAKQYDSVLPFIERNDLDPWTHNKAIQKSLESLRITAEHKEYLKSLKRNGKN